MRDIDQKCRDGKFEHGSNCEDYVIDSEGMLEIVEGKELIERNEILGYNHRGNLTGLDLEAFFDEELNQLSERE